MATHLKEIVTVYEREKRDLRKKHLDFSDSLLESLAYDAIGPHLKSDKYSVLTTLDNIYTRLILKNMGPAVLISRLEEMGYKIRQPDKTKNAIIAEKDTDKGKLAFSFEFSQQNSILAVPDVQPESEVKEFLKELYREHPGTY